MNRRSLIAHGMGAVGVGLTGAVLPGCGALRVSHQSLGGARIGSVAIIGAGIAGLAAASALRAAGVDEVFLLEARDRIGGRIWTSRIGDYPIDLGASWIHGIDGNPVANIAAENDIQILPTDYDNESIHFHDAEVWNPSREHVVEDFWKFARKRPRDSLGALYEQFVNTSVPTEEARRYLAYVLNTTIEHEFSADIHDLSLSSVSGGNDWPGTMRSFRVATGKLQMCLRRGWISDSDKQLLGSTIENRKSSSRQQTVGVSKPRGSS